jgi:hypothetical protein
MGDNIQVVGGGKMLLKKVKVGLMMKRRRMVLLQHVSFVAFLVVFVLRCS